MTLAEALDTIAELRERIRQLEEELAPTIQLPDAWGITNSEGQILKCILAANGGIISMANIQTRVYGMKSAGVTDAVIYQHIATIRRKLPWLQLNTAYGRGYYINGKDINAFYVRVRLAHDELIHFNND